MDTFKIGIPPAEKFSPGVVGACAILSTVVMRQRPNIKIVFHPLYRDGAEDSRAGIEDVQAAIGFGGMYNDSQLLFDPHGTTLHHGDRDCTPFGSAGLVWKHFGMSFLRSMGMDVAGDKNGNRMWMTSHVFDSLLKDTYDELMRTVFRAIDRYDNNCDLVNTVGIDYLCEDPDRKTELRNDRSALSLYDALYDLNEPPAYYSITEVDLPGLSKDGIKESFEHDSRFIATLRFFRFWLMSRASHTFHAMMDNRIRGIMVNAYNNRKYDKILVLPEYYADWTRVLIEQLKDRSVVYAIMPDKKGSIWRLRTVPRAVGSTAVRKLLPAVWGAKSEFNFSEITKVPGAKFCNAACTEAGATSEPAAMALCNIALANPDEQTHIGVGFVNGQIKDNDPVKEAESAGGVTISTEGDGFASASLRRRIAEQENIEARPSPADQLPNPAHEVGADAKVHLITGEGRTQLYPSPVPDCPDLIRDDESQIPTLEDVIRATEENNNPLAHNDVIPFPGANGVPVSPFAGEPMS